MSSPTSTRPRLVILTADGTPDPANLTRLRELAEVELVTREGLTQAIAGADALALWDFFSDALREAWPAADALRWVHVCAAGVDAILFDELRDSDVLLTNAHGVFDRPIAEFVAAAVLSEDKLFLESASLQRQRKWRHREVHRAQGRRVLVVGTGGIGREIARLLTTLGYAVRGAGRTARADDEDFGTVVASAELAQEVGWADHVVLIAPLTPQTRGLVDASVLAAMRRDAHLVNVGRGALVDQEALVSALRERHIRSATLDVFAQEPLPADDPLWVLDNVRISAHMCGDVIGWRDELSALLEDNLRRYAAGEPLRNEVDLASGYVPGRR